MHHAVGPENFGHIRVGELHRAVPQVHKNMGRLNRRKAKIVFTKPKAVLANLTTGVGRLESNAHRAITKKLYGQYLTSGKDVQKGRKDLGRSNRFVNARREESHQAVLADQSSRDRESQKGQNKKVKPGWPRKKKWMGDQNGRPTERDQIAIKLQKNSQPKGFKRRLP